MARVKGGFKTKRRRKKWIKLAKGYWGKRKNCYRIARTQVMKSLLYAYQGRKKKKRDMRKLWIIQINAKCRENGLTYSKFIWGMKKLNININRKILSSLAKENNPAFTELTNKVKELCEKP